MKLNQMHFVGAWYLLGAYLIPYGFIFYFVHYLGIEFLSGLYCLLLPAFFIMAGILLFLEESLVNIWNSELAERTRGIVGGIALLLLPFFLTNPLVKNLFVPLYFSGMALLWAIPVVWWRLRQEKFPPRKRKLKF